MPTVKRFEELTIWQLARNQCQAVFDLVEDGRFAFDLPLRDQINRSSASVMDNIAEGFDRFSRAEFRNFLVISRGSCAETRSQLYRAIDRKYLTREESDDLVRRATNLSTRITNLINHLSRSDFKTKPTGDAPSSQRAEEPDIPYATELSYDLPTEHISYA